MSTDERIKALTAALRRAIKECAEHNAEYHHVTPEPLLAEWEALLGDEQQGRRGE